MCLHSHNSGRINGFFHRIANPTWPLPIDSCVCRLSKITGFIHRTNGQNGFTDRDMTTLKDKKIQDQTKFNPVTQIFAADSDTARPLA